MKNSKITKIVLIIMICLSMILVTRYVFADEINLDQTNSLLGNNFITLNSDDNGNTVGNNTVNNTVNNTANKVVLTTNNTSNYNNNTSLPKTGVGDSIPGVIFVVVLGISAVYAYKKMQDYKNI